MDKPAQVSNNDVKDVAELLVIPDQVMQERVERGDWVRRGDLAVDDIQSFARLPDNVRSLDFATKRDDVSGDFRNWDVEKVVRGQGRKLFNAAFAEEDNGPKNTAERRDQLMDSLAKSIFAKLIEVKVYGTMEDSGVSNLSLSGRALVGYEFAELEALGIVLRWGQGRKFIEPFLSDYESDGNLFEWMRDFLQPKLSLLLRNFAVNGERLFQNKEISLVVAEDRGSGCCRFRLYSYEKDRPEAFGKKVVDHVLAIARDYSSGEMQERFYCESGEEFFRCQGLFTFMANEDKGNMDFVLSIKEIEDLGSFPFYRFDMNSAQVLEWMRCFVEQGLVSLKNLHLGGKPIIGGEMSASFYTSSSLNEEYQSVLRDVEDPVILLSLKFSPAR